MSAEELQEKLDQINEAMTKANGDPKKMTQFLTDIADPQDNLNCEGCQ